MSLVAIRLGLLLAGVVFNEAHRKKRSKARRQRRQHRVRDCSEKPDFNLDYDHIGYYDNQEHTPHISTLNQGSHRPYSNRGPRDQGVWILDTGAAQHSCSDRHLFSTYRPTRASVTGIGSQVLEVYGTGNVHLDLIVDGLPRTLVLENVSHVPDQTCEHLLSFDPFLRRGGRLWTEGWTTYLADINGEVLLQCSRVNGACQVNLDLDPEWTMKQIRSRKGEI